MDPKRFEEEQKRLLEESGATTEAPQAEELQATFDRLFPKGTLVNVEGFTFKIIQKEGKEITLKLLPLKRTKARKRKH